MWLFTTDGFYSTVQHNDDENLMLVRAREHKDLVTLRHRLASLGQYIPPIDHTPAADYAWRVTLTREQWYLFLEDSAQHISYPNFKAAVEQRQGAFRARIYQEVWAVMRWLQTNGGR